MKKPTPKKKVSSLDELTKAADDLGLPTSKFSNEDGMNLTTVDMRILTQVPAPILQIIQDQSVAMALAAAIGVHTDMNSNRSVSMVYQILASLSENIKELDIPKALKDLAILHDAAQKSIAMFEGANEEKH